VTTDGETEAGKEMTETAIEIDTHEVGVVVGTEIVAEGGSVGVGQGVHLGERKETDAEVSVPKVLCCNLHLGDPRSSRLWKGSGR
jgi:hypothetical protein